MPRAAAHYRANLFLLVVGLFFARQYMAVTFSELLVFSLCFLYATFLAHPDMDLANQIRFFSFRGLLTLPFRLFYAPFVRHRSMLSHSVPWGSLLRLSALFLFGFFCLVMFTLMESFVFSSVSVSDLRPAGAQAGEVFWGFFGLVGRSFAGHPALWIAGAAGFLIADIFHIVLDRFL